MCSRISDWKFELKKNRLILILTSFHCHLKCMLIHSLHINTSLFLYIAFVTVSAILETEEMNSTEASTNSTTLEHFLWPSSIVDMFVCSINFLIGFPVHSYIIWLIVTGTGSGVASEFFNINLSICELWTSFNCLLSVLSTSTNFVQLMALSSFLAGVIVAGRPLFQSLICVERYLAVVHPVIFLKFKPLRYRVICCTVVWIITLASCLCLMFSSFLNNFIWFTGLFPIQFLLFLFIQLFCLVAVLRALKQSGPGERGRERRSEENHMKRRAFYLILIITVCLCISFGPYILASVFIIFTKHNANTYNTFALVCFILGGFLHPVLFLHRTGKLPCVSVPHKTWNCNKTLLLKSLSKCAFYCYINILGYSCKLNLVNNFVFNEFLVKIIDHAV